ncbi:hypothetical protein P152DRAFT_476731 [Eremomyces bilateralis CBS 781.70]|uniref:Nudix hydrolase domain-containing protein n=1 Tax=Eremomyces bilateralis CBS 781.70 TaxID=1392243 RepID=A0A6G1FU18_9PEZI|nr:uncharacterized protein P152DRAFT_476731 [Eremomyces bilateralis CBS 781.70]KAF1809169.1 hypothetical protein P152DRAFT_476731 [Eremomyces bilateralis CBS 781.70]
MASTSKSRFALPKQSGQPEIWVTLPDGQASEDLRNFVPFQTWQNRLQKSIESQNDPKHAFHDAPYYLRSIEIQSVDYFGGHRVGFMKLRAEVSNDKGEKLPGSIFLRGGSVAILLLLQPDDVPLRSEEEKHVVLTVQARVPSGSFTFVELPAGMIDDAGSFAGAAAKELGEETGLVVSETELIDLTKLVNGYDDIPDHGTLEEAMYPSPGGCDEFISIFLCEKRVARHQLEDFKGKLTGQRDHGEKITLKVIPLKDLWKVGARDAKALSALALYNGLKQEGRL